MDPLLVMRPIEDALNEARVIANARIHRTSFVPTEQDAIALREKAQILRDLDNKIDLEIQRLQEQKAALHAQLQVHDALLSPYRGLPPETWSEIFLLALPDDWEDRPAGRRTLNLTRVCVMWRNIALSTPRLWTTLAFFSVDNPLANHLNGVARELDRTAQAPLDLTVDMTIPPLSFTSHDDYWNDDAWELLCSQSHRFSRLSLKHIPLYAYYSLQNHPLPLLRSLSISLDAADEDPDIEIPYELFRNAPGVHALHIGYFTEPFTVEVPSSWTITELSITCGDYPGGDDRPPLEPCMEAITACSGTLRELAITGESLGRLPKIPITFPVLDKLRLDGGAAAACRMISAPQLKDVTFASDVLADRTPNVLRKFKKLLQNSSGCKFLRSLALLDIAGLEPSEFISILHRVPQLTELEISHFKGIEIDDDSPLSLEMLETLSRDSGEDDVLMLLPNLQHLHLAFNGMLGDDEEDPELREAVWEIFISRKHPRLVEGTMLARLEKLTTDAGALSYP